MFPTVVVCLWCCSCGGCWGRFGVVSCPPLVFLYLWRVGVFIVFVSSWVFSDEGVDICGFQVERMFVVVE